MLCYAIFDFNLYRRQKTRREKESMVEESEHAVESAFLYENMIVVGAVYSVDLSLDESMGIVKT